MPASIPRASRPSPRARLDLSPSTASRLKLTKRRQVLFEMLEKRRLLATTPVNILTGDVSALTFHDAASPGANEVYRLHDVVIVNPNGTTTPLNSTPAMARVDCRLAESMRGIVLFPERFGPANAAPFQDTGNFYFAPSTRGAASNPTADLIGDRDPRRAGAFKANCVSSIPLLRLHPRARLPPATPECGSGRWLE